MDFKTVLEIVSKAINNSGIIKNCEDFFINRYSKKIDYYRLYCAGVVLTKELQDIGQWDKKDNVETVYDKCLNALKTPKSKNVTREEWNEVHGEIDKNENIKKALVFLKYLFNNFSKYSEMAISATNYGFWGTAYSLVAYLGEKYPAINEFTEEMNQHTYFAIISNFADIEKSWNEFIKNNIWDDLEGIDIKSDAGENAKILATKMYADNRIMSELCYSIKDARNTCVHAENGYRDSVMAPAFQGACLSMIEALSVDDEVKQRNKEETLIKLGKIIENKPNPDVSHFSSNSVLEIPPSIRFPHNKFALLNFWKMYEPNLNEYNSNVIAKDNCDNYPNTYWATMTNKKLNKNWYFIGTDKDNKISKLFHIEAGKFKIQQFGINKNEPRRKEAEPDLREKFEVCLDNDNYIDQIKKEADFSDCLYAIADFNKGEIEWFNKDN